MGTFPLDLVALEKKQVFTPTQIKIQEEIQTSKWRDILLPIGEKKS